MSSSDEEGEIIPDSVTNYHFVDDKQRVTSFSILPFQWSDGEMTGEVCPKIFLCGSADDGLQQIYKKVVAWKLELSYVLPEIYVLYKGQMWIKLHKPRKSYEEAIKTILVTIHFLHFVKKNQLVSHDTIWNQMRKTFSTFEIPPSKNDLSDHKQLIVKVASTDKDIAQSEFMATFLSKTQDTRATVNEDMRALKKLKFVIDGYDEYDGNDGEVDEDKRELFDSACAYCDDGGEILCCEGRCVRSFHPTAESGAESFCESLGYSREQADAIQTFLCKNCQYQKHQCFACGLLGSSNKSAGADVFPCVSATCGYFYHPKCVSKLLFPSDESKANELESKTAEGDSFACPMHKCYQCEQVEDKNVFELQFAICRRCPKAYHRKCLPRTIMFQSVNEKNIPCRAWEGLLRSRILIYCMDHTIISKIGTPRRDHLVFPDDDIKKQYYPLESRLPLQVMVGAGRRSKILGSLEEKPTVKVAKPSMQVYSTSKIGNSIGRVEKRLPKHVSECKRDPHSCSPKDNRMSVSDKHKHSKEEQGKSSQKFDLLKSKKVGVGVRNIPYGKTNTVHAMLPSLHTARGTRPSGKDEIEKRVLAIVESSNSSFNLEENIKEKKGKSITSYSSNFMEEKTITLGKVERSVKAIRAALKKLEDGGTIEDAKAICEPEVLNQVIRWKRKLSVYLAPVLHGMRYTSFGRHFTKVDKLKEIVERLQWYVRDGDTIVDFSCGSNDFSCLMKEALDKMGKKCSFKNYDLIQPKNVFCFERRDWMSIRVEELPEGRNLIVGLNPPFGVHAALANKFIAKALQFRPRLLILIVPKETRRLDTRKFRYDLIWEDHDLLSGKSFYLPGSVDAHAQQLDQRNKEAPPLYLWSHPGWTTTHRAIARERGHIRMEENVHVTGMNIGAPISNYLTEDKHGFCTDFSGAIEGGNDANGWLYDMPEDLDDNAPLQPVGAHRLEAEDVEMELSTPTASPVINRDLAGYSAGSFGVLYNEGNAQQFVQHAQQFPTYFQDNFPVIQRDPTAYIGDYSAATFGALYRQEAVQPAQQFPISFQENYQRLQNPPAGFVGDSSANAGNGNTQPAAEGFPSYLQAHLGGWIMD